MCCWRAGGGQNTTPDGAKVGVDSRCSSAADGVIGGEIFPGRKVWFGAVGARSGGLSWGFWRWKLRWGRGHLDEPLETCCSSCLQSFGLL